VKQFSFYKELSEIWSKTYIDLRVKYLLFKSDFNETWIFSTNFQKIHKHQISQKSIQWAKLSHADGGMDGRTDRQDMTKLTVALHNFANVLKTYHKQFVAPKTVEATKNRKDKHERLTDGDWFDQTQWQYVQSHDQQPCCLNACVVMNSSQGKTVHLISFSSKTQRTERRRAFSR